MYEIRRCLRSCCVQVLGDIGVWNISFMEDFFGAKGAEEGLIELNSGNAVLVLYVCSGLTTKDGAFLIPVWAFNFNH